MSLQAFLHSHTSHTLWVSYLLPGPELPSIGCGWSRPVHWAPDFHMQLAFGCLFLDALQHCTLFTFKMKQDMFSPLLLILNERCLPPWDSQVTPDFTLSLTAPHVEYSLTQISSLSQQQQHYPETCWTHKFLNLSSDLLSLYIWEQGLASPFSQLCGQSSCKLRLEEHMSRRR